MTYLEVMYNKSPMSRMQKDGHFWVIDIGDGRPDILEQAVFFVDGIKIKLHPSTECSLDTTREG